MRRKRFILALILDMALVPVSGWPAGGQTVDSQTTGAIDPALLAKANAGDAVSEVLVGESYAAGKGVVQDYNEAADWYRKAAEQGDVGAQATVGLLYSIGQGLPQSYVEGYYWLDLAAQAKGPNQEKYAANRQMIGTHITADELADVEERVAKWLATHPR